VLALGAVAVLLVVTVLVVVTRDDNPGTDVSTVTTLQPAPARPHADVELASTYFPDDGDVKGAGVVGATSLPTITVDAVAVPVSNEHRTAFAANGIKAELDQLLTVPGIDATKPTDAPPGRPVSFHVTVDVFATKAGAAATRKYVNEQLGRAGYQTLPPREGTRPAALQTTFQGLSTTQAVVDTGNNVVVRVVGVCNQCFPGQAPTGFDRLVDAVVEHVSVEHTDAEMNAIRMQFDRTRVIDVWVAWGEAWKQGTEAGLTYIEAHDYPGLPASPDFCRRYFGVTGPGFRVESTVRPDSIKPDPGWKIPRGRLEGTPAEGRVYVMTVDQIDTAGTRTSIAAHVTVLDGRPLLFFDCTIGK
jgi:hypothetical protein